MAKLLTILFWIIICGSLCSAQDLHYSNYNYNKLYLNPGNTGGFNGTLRVGASQRNQYRTFIGEAYQSSMIWIDSQLSIGKNERHWLGVGFYLLTDSIGDLGLSQNGTSFKSCLSSFLR